jgi:Flp pilus assembly protein TadD
MRFLRMSPVVTAFVLLLCASKLLHAAPDSSFSGRLVFDVGSFSCDQQCRVTLLSLGARPVETVFADLAGNFTFHAVPRGNYSIRVEIDGYEPLIYPIRDTEAAYGITINVPLTRRSVATAVNKGADADVVNVSEFLQRYPKRAVTYFEKGNDLRKKKRDEDAIKYFKDAIDLAPTFYEAHSQLGIAYRDTGRKDEAEREFLRAHELNSTAVEPLLNLTALYIEENDAQRAVSTGEQAIKANSHSAPAFFSLGVALYKAAQLDRAEVALKRALDLAPKMATIHLALANVYLKLHSYDKTLEQLNTYIAENPKGQQLEQATQMRDQLLQAQAQGR